MRALVAVFLVVLDSSQSQVLFSDDFGHGLDRWQVHGERAVQVRPSGDPRHGAVLELTPNGDVAVLIRGSERWGAVRFEGDMLFPTDENNYLGFIYSHVTRGSRQDFGLIYVKGNDSYLQVNPHRDFNVSRTVYPEFHVPLSGASAVKTGVWQSFALEVVRGAAHLYVGPTTTPQVTFAGFEFTRGAIGLQPRSVGGPVWVDNITVRAIDRFSYDGPAVPETAYSRARLLTDWQVSGPLTETDDRMARDPSSLPGRWTAFPADDRGAVVTGRVADYHGRSTVAYFRTTVQAAGAGAGELQFSTVDDLAVWVNGHFQSFVARQEAAWFDFAAAGAHPARRVPIAWNAGANVVVIRVRGGVYASGGFYARAESP
jgi:hypothetical protein